MAKSPKSTTQGKTPTFTQQNTPRGKLLRMGMPSGLEPKGAPSAKP